MFKQVGGKADFGAAARVFEWRLGYVQICVVILESLENTATTAEMQFHGTR
jgi:hypothetical protein